MPEQYREKRRDAFTLSKADEAGYFVRARCGLCSIKRVYRPIDLLQLVKDIGMVELERKLRCEQCGNKDHMQVDFWYPTGREREGLKVRRVAGIQMVRKVIWRDEDG